MNDKIAKRATHFTFGSPSYGGVLEVLKVSKDFRVFKVSLAEIVYISRVIVGADRRVCPLLFFVRVLLWADTSVRYYGFV